MTPSTRRWWLTSDHLLLIVDHDGGLAVDVVPLGDALEAGGGDDGEVRLVVRVIHDEATRVPDYSDGTLTENTRVGYPVDCSPRGCSR